jgi:hypothetical protein
LKQAVVKFPCLACWCLYGGRIHGKAECREQCCQSTVEWSGERRHFERAGHEAGDQAGAGGILDNEIADGVRVLNRRAPFGAPEEGKAVKHYPGW